MNLFALIAAAASGLMMALQGSLNTSLAKVTGLLEATFVVHVIGTMAALCLLLVGLGHGNWQVMVKGPWYTYFGGLIGVGIVYLVASSISKVGVAAATTAIIVGQVSTAAVVDHFGWFGLEAIAFNWFKGVGIAFMAVGAWLLLHK